jgi:hypothetical protein
MFFLIAAIVGLVAMASSIMLPSTTFALDLSTGRRWILSKHWLHNNVQLDSLRTHIRHAIAAKLPSITTLDLDTSFKVLSFVLFMISMTCRYVLASTISYPQRGLTHRSMVKVQGLKTSSVTTQEHRPIDASMDNNDAMLHDDTYSELSDTDAESHSTNITYNITNNFRAPIARLVLSGFGSGGQADSGRFMDQLSGLGTHRLLELDDEDDESSDYEGSDAGEDVESLTDGKRDDILVVQ